MKSTRNDSLLDIAFTVVEAEQYLAQLLEALPKAKTRIVLAAMAVLWGEKTDAVFAEINKALDRGVRVHILLDTYTSTGIGRKMPKRLHRIQFKKTLQLLQVGRDKGARVSTVGNIGLNPFKGRCHVKITVVDNHCFSFGGVNFEDESFANSDYMLYANNGALGDCLEQLVARIAAGQRPLPDAEVTIENGQSVLFDGGRQKHSIIYDRAVTLAKQAKKVWFVSQLAPSNTLAQALKTTHTNYFFNRPEQMHIISSMGQAFDQQRYRINNHYTKSVYIHAKFMLFELQDGTKALISGSHNLTYRGVAYGTQEIALYSTDTNLWNQLKDFIDKHIA